jgi:predicted esterase
LFFNMDQQELSFQFKARYFKSGEINDHTREVWFVIHGYGQLARYFIRKFEPLSEKSICVIAPEGLSRFYHENFQPGVGRKNDRVGATWMTKENRLMDIHNYVEYLTAIYQREIGTRTIPVTVLGFSQGSATASRWVMSDRINFEQLILWAGVFPPDMDFGHGKDVLASKKVALVYGTRDPFLNDERFTEMDSLAARLAPHAKKIAFDGEHEIDSATLTKLTLDSGF